MAHADQYGSGFNLDALMVPTKAATLFTAQENSLFVGGNMIPSITVPAGSMTASVPHLAEISGGKLTAEVDPGDDLATTLAVATPNNIDLNLHYARSVVRDIGGVDANEIGRTLGNGVIASFDTDVVAAMAGLTANNIGVSAAITLDDIMDSVGTIKAAGEMGQLWGVVAADAYSEVLKAIGSAAFAGGDFQNAAMTNGYIGRIAGVNLFVSAHLTGTAKCAIFGQDAMRIAKQGDVRLEAQRRAAAVGTDLVASLAAGVGVIDATRGVYINAV